MGIMQDDLCHPYILSTTVLSDNYVLCKFCAADPFCQVSSDFVVLFIIALCHPRLSLFTFYRTH